MKNTLLLFGLAGLTLTLVSFTIIQKSHEVQEPKKGRHIKMTKIENGKKMELDTVFTDDQVFVWNGDTVNPVKHMKHLSPSGFDKAHQVDVKVEHKGGNEKVMIIKHKGGKAGEPMIWRMDSGDDMEIITEDNDSTGKRIVVRKRLRDGDENQVFYFKNGDMGHFPPMPPVLPMKMMKMQQSGQIINLNDPNIVSYRKKEMSGGREKIEIIRKKTADNENMSFDFNFDNQLMPPPPPPPAPEMIREFNDGDQNIKVIEKKVKVDGKEGKEIKVEVKSKENK
ncbi:MAG: hypothetical protein Q8S54_07635 [Bacteroidota bacterium]|nr:hypothetical protein [Odoribacter sp.]MDP3643047.1 hypothetical protein [Bacteroidota bacterium]